MSSEPVNIRLGSVGMEITNFISRASAILPVIRDTLQSAKAYFDLQHSILSAELEEMDQPQQKKKEYEMGQLKAIGNEHNITVGTPLFAADGLGGYTLVGKCEQYKTDDGTAIIKCN